MNRGRGGNMMVAYNYLHPKQRAPPEQAPAEAAIAYRRLRRRVLPLHNERSRQTGWTGPERHHCCRKEAAISNSAAFALW